MSHPPKFFFTFKRNIELVVRNVRRLSFRHFCDEYDYDDFLEGDALACATARSLAIEFCVRFLEAVPTEYSNALSIGVVNFLAEWSGRTKLEASDIDAVKTLISLPTKTEQQLAQWLDAYFRDVA